MEDEVLRRLMSLELGKLNQGMVTQPVPLAALAAAVPPWLHGRLRLPITVYEPHDAPGDGYVEDAAAVEALEAMRAATTQPRGGRLWMSAALWRRLMESHPTCFQRVHV